MLDPASPQHPGEVPLPCPHLEQLVPCPGDAFGRKSEDVSRFVAKHLCHVLQGNWGSSPRDNIWKKLEAGSATP